MEPIQLLLFILTSVGITNILVNGSIFDSLRREENLIAELFRCPSCTGFWVGMVVSFFFPISLPIAGAISSLMSHIFNSSVYLIESAASYFESMTTNGEIDE